MDSIFLLSPEARSRFLRSAARVLGCTYICLWSPLYHPASNYFTSKDGWYHEDDSSHQSSSSESPSRRLFDAYRRSLCGFRCCCVPGWAYKSSLPYIELKDSDLMNLALMPAQRQFYQEARIKTAVFLGCTSGEIELGTTTSSTDVINQTPTSIVPTYINYFKSYNEASWQPNMQMNAHKVFSEEFIQQSQLGEEFINQPTRLGELFSPLDQSRPSSSSSSLRSLAVGSPEYSSLLLTKAGAASFMPESTAEQSFVLPHQATMQAYGRYRDVPFPSPASDDAAMTRAMLAVISSNSSPLQLDQAYRSSVGTFKPYSPAFAPGPDTIPSLHGQRMIKMVINQLRSMTMRRFESRTQDVRATSSQLHHVISERKRRKKLNEIFHDLRMLLPPGSKKDKASVLANTRNYMNDLKAQVSELKDRNRLLETQLHNPHENGEVGDANERVEVQISRTCESTSEAQRINLIITVRVECNMIDLILNVLGCLKKMGDTTLVSVEASTRSPQTNVCIKACFTLQVKTSDCDEESFKEVVTKAVDAAVARSATPID